MKKFRLVVALMIMAMIVGSTAWALNATDHVKVAPNGKGDLLFFPWYYVLPADAPLAIQSKVSVINTSNDYSVVAKVVYRSGNWSDELLDHLIFLSPNDVWTADLKIVGGKVHLVCNDDSMLGKAPSGKAVDSDFANITPVSQPLGNPQKNGVLWENDSNNFGYIEVIEAAAAPVSVLSKGTDGKVQKTKIYDWYDGLFPTDIATQYAPVNVLTGYQQNTIGLNQTLVQARVFADYKNEAKLDVFNETLLGTDANNSLAELEAAMANYDVALPYYANQGQISYHLFNFPTKISAFDSTAKGTYKAYSKSPYWTAVNTKCETYFFNIYDLLENTTTSPGSIFSPPIPTTQLEMCEEVFVSRAFEFVEGSLFKEGWARYNWQHAGGVSGVAKDPAVTVSFKGIPTLPSVVTFNQYGGVAEAPAAYSADGVSVNGTSYPYYPFSE